MRASWHVVRGSSREGCGSASTPCEGLVSSLQGAGQAPHQLIAGARGALCPINPLRKFNRAFVCLCEARGPVHLCTACGSRLEADSARGPGLGACVNPLREPGQLTALARSAECGVRNAQNLFLPIAIRHPSRKNTINVSRAVTSTHCRMEPRACGPACKTRSSSFR